MGNWDHAGAWFTSDARRRSRPSPSGSSPSRCTTASSPTASRSAWRCCRSPAATARLRDPRAAAARRAAWSPARRPRPLRRTASRSTSSARRRAMPGRAGGARPADRRGAAPGDPLVRGRPHLRARSTPRSSRPPRATARRRIAATDAGASPTSFEAGHRASTRRTGTCSSALWLADLDPPREPPRPRAGGEPVRVGLVCPYSWDVPGGVQAHVRDLAEALIRLGHEVSVLAPGRRRRAPARRTSSRPAARSRCRTTARSPGCPSGSCPRDRVRRWLRDGDFDVLHVHEPTAPEPVACSPAGRRTARSSATFHTSHRALPRADAAYGDPPDRAGEDQRADRGERARARTTLVEHLGGDAVLIPNGVDGPSRSRDAEPLRRLAGRRAARSASSAASTSRARACRCCSRRCPALAAERPDVRLLVAGPGDVDDVRDAIPPALARPGRRSSAWSARRTRPGCCAPSTSTSRRTPAARASASSCSRRWRPARRCVASDLDAFRRVLDDGTAGALFANEDPAVAREGRRPRCSATRPSARRLRGRGTARVGELRLGARRRATSSTVYETVDARAARRSARTCRGQVFGRFTRLPGGAEPCRDLVCWVVAARRPVRCSTCGSVAGRLDRLHVRLEAAAGRARRPAAAPGGGRQRAGRTPASSTRRRPSCCADAALRRPRAPGRTTGPRGRPPRATLSVALRAALDDARRSPSCRASPGLAATCVDEARRGRRPGACWPAGSTTTPCARRCGCGGAGWSAGSGWPGTRRVAARRSRSTTRRRRPCPERGPRRTYPPSHVSRHGAVGRAPARARGLASPSLAPARPCSSLAVGARRGRCRRRPEHRRRRRSPTPSADRPPRVQRSLLSGRPGADGRPGPRREVRQHRATPSRTPGCRTPTSSTSSRSRAASPATPRSSPPRSRQVMGPIRSARIADLELFAAVRQVRVRLLRRAAPARAR